MECCLNFIDISDGDNPWTVLGQSNCLLWQERPFGVFSWIHVLMKKRCPEVVDVAKYCGIMANRPTRSSRRWRITKNNCAGVFLRLFLSNQTTWWNVHKRVKNLWWGDFEQWNVCLRAQCLRIFVGHVQNAKILRILLGLEYFNISSTKLGEGLRILCLTDLNTTFLVILLSSGG